MAGEASADKVQAVLESISELRFRFSQFQDSIDRYLSFIEDSWNKIKSKLADFEARLATLEVKLSAVPAADLAEHDLEMMQKELEEIGRDLSGIRLTFGAAFEEENHRIM